MFIYARNLKKQKKDSVPSGLHADYRKPVESRNNDTTQQSKDDEDCPVRYGGLIPDNEKDKLEIQAMKKRGVKKTNNENVECHLNIYAIYFWYFESQTIKIKSNPAVPKTLVEARQGAKSWSTKHLPSGTTKEFEKCVAPMLRMKTGLLLPWKSPSLHELQAIVDDVFGEGKYEVKEDNVWYGLVSAMIPHYYAELTT